MGILESGNKAFRDFVVEGVPSSGANEPAKSEIRTFVKDVSDAVTGLQDGASGGHVSAETWTALSALTGTYAGEPAEVPASDTGTHTDPVVGGTKANAGKYRWNNSPAGWKWIAGLDAVGGVQLTSVAGSSTAYTATDPTAPSSYTGRKYFFVPHVTSGLNPTINVSSLGARSIRDRNAATLPAGALLAGFGYALWDDGTYLRLQDPWEIVSGDYNWNYAVVGLNGNVLGGEHQDGTLYDQGDYLPAADARNRGYSAAVDARVVAGLQAIDADDNGFISDGQSNDQGPEAWPAFTGQTGNTNLNDPDGMPGGTAGVVMMGTDIRPTVASTAGWTSLGTNAFNNAKANARNNDVLMTEADQALLVQGNGRPAETLVLSGALQLHRMMTAARFLPIGDTTRRLVVAACGVGGQSLGQLMKGNPQDGTPNQFLRYTGAVQNAKNLSTAASRSFRLVGIPITQGESDLLGTGMHPNRVLFKAARRQWYNDLQNDSMAITGQTHKPAIFQILVGHTYARDTDPQGHPDYYVPNADMELADEWGDVFTVGPYYGVTDKGAHLDSNGVRRMGAKLGQVAYRVLVEKKGWEPCRPIAIERHGVIVDIHCHVPKPPLVFKTAYVDGVPTTCLNWGFRVTDAQGVITCTPAIVAPTVIRLTLGALPRGGCVIYYACNGDLPTIAGQGNICDSEVTDPETIYKYWAGSGMDTDENIAEFINKKYDMNNWLIPFGHAPGWKLARI